MTQPAPTLDDLLRSYERTLVAKAQLVEFASWGDSTIGAFRVQISRHGELEAAYLESLLERRRLHGSGVR